MNLRFMALMLPDVAQSIRALTTADAITALEARDKRVREEWPAAALSLYDRVYVWRRHYRRRAKAGGSNSPSRGIRFDGL